MSISGADKQKMGNMTPEDYEIAVKLCDRDPEFKKLWEEHHELKSRLKDLREKGHLTPDEEMEMKKIIALQRLNLPSEQIAT